MIETMENYDKKKTNFSLSVEFYVIYFEETT